MALRPDVESITSALKRAAEAPHVPNAETVAAMNEARSMPPGEFGTAEQLFESLESPQ